MFSGIVERRGLGYTADMRRNAVRWLGVWAGAWLTATAAGQSRAALRFFGTGTGQQDRVRIAIDDNAPGPDASTPCDVGAGSFTIEFWVRGRAADNPAAGSGGGEFLDERWIEGHIVVDRDIWGASDRDWGVSLAGGLVRFGTGRGEGPGRDDPHTLEGRVNVLDDRWRHVAVVRDAASGRKLIYVDGVLDIASASGRSNDDLSYPDGGDPSPVTPWGPYIVLGAEKHDAGPSYPSYRGLLDEVRVWSVALTGDRIAAIRDRVLPAGEAGLAAAYRFEEGAGTAVVSSVPGAPTGELIAGVPGNGEWALASADPGNTAPVRGECAADFNGDGFVDFFDFDDFVACFEGGACPTGRSADFNGDGFADFFDYDDYVAAFEAGC